MEKGKCTLLYFTHIFVDIHSTITSPSFEISLKSNRFLSKSKATNASN